VEAANLLSGLLGALLGVTASFVIYLAETRRSETAAIRAVFREAVTNEQFLEELVLRGENPGPISDSAYLTHFPQLASRLSADEVFELGTAYLHVPTCERLRLEFASGRPLSPADLHLIEHTYAKFVQVNPTLLFRAYGRRRAPDPEELAIAARHQLPSHGNDQGVNADGGSRRK
jgi:hypothetical protein